MFIVKILKVIIILIYLKSKIIFNFQVNNDLLENIIYFYFYIIF